MLLRKRICLLLALLTCGVLPPSAGADNRAGAFTLTPFIGGHVFDGDQLIESDLSFGLAMGFNLTRNWGMELAGNYVNTDFEAPLPGDVEVLTYHIDLIYSFMPASAFVPYLAVGAGGITLEPDNSASETEAMGNYGFGLKAFLTDNLALRYDVRHLLYEMDSDLENNLLMNIGLNLNFGGNRPALRPRGAGQ